MTNNLYFGNFLADDVAIYICAVEEFASVDGLPPERKAYALSATNEKIRNQRAAVWHLLEFAFAHRLGIDAKQVRFSHENGKIGCSVCEFSISHTDGFVAVALSHRPVGVDAELLTNHFNEKLFYYITTQNERQAAAFSPLVTAALWTAKESLFKQDGLGIFAPSKTETSGKSVFSRTDGNLVVSVATHCANLQFFCVCNGQACPVKLDTVQIFSGGGLS